MFGYHDSDRCIFDLWSPVDDPNHCAIENRAFSPYAKHTQECEDIVNQVVDNYHLTGQLDFNFEVDDCFDDSDLEYIKKRIKEKI